MGKYIVKQVCRFSVKAPKCTHIWFGIYEDNRLEKALNLKYIENRRTKIGDDQSISRVSGLWL